LDEQHEHGEWAPLLPSSLAASISSGKDGSSYAPSSPFFGPPSMPSAELALAKEAMEPRLSHPPLQQHGSQHDAQSSTTTTCIRGII